jgi:hypothetical protein
MKRLTGLILTGLGICTLPFLLSACSRGWKNTALPSSFDQKLFVRVEGDPESKGRTPVWGWETIVIVQNNTCCAAHPAFRVGKNVRYYSKRTVPVGGKAALRVGPGEVWFGWVKQDGTPAEAAPIVTDRIHLF